MAVAVLKLLVVAVLLWLVRGKLEDTWTDFCKNPRPMSPGWGHTLRTPLPCCLAARRHLLVLGIAGARSECAVIRDASGLFIGHLGKYVPGKAMVVVLRTGLLASHRVNTGIVVASIFWKRSR